MKILGLWTKSSVSNLNNLNDLDDLNDLNDLDDLVNLDDLDDLDDLDNLDNLDNLNDLNNFSSGGPVIVIRYICFNFYWRNERKILNSFRIKTKMSILGPFWPIVSFVPFNAKKREYWFNFSQNPKPLFRSILMHFRPNRVFPKVLLRLTWDFRRKNKMFADFLCISPWATG